MDLKILQQNGKGSYKVTFKEFRERIEYKIYFKGDTLWAAYGQDSGTTSLIKI